jgi:hypothetical protein
VTPNELELIWSKLPAALPSQFSGKRVPGLNPVNPIYLAIDASGTRSLLVAIPSSTAAPQWLTTTKSLVIRIDALEIGDSQRRTYLHLVCTRPDHHATFAALVSNIIESIKAFPTNSVAIVGSCVEKWRSFWSVTQVRLTRDQALGLFGELWFLYRWLGKISRSNVEGWRGPLGARHDFQWNSASVEVKAAASGPNVAAVHIISSLSQLEDAESGQLFLFSLHVADDVLARNTLPAIVTRIVEAIGSDVDLLGAFNERLAAAGYNPANAQAYERPLRVLKEELYVVNKDFPRLTKERLVGVLFPAIGDISYSLSMAGCVEFRVATSPDDPRVLQLRS